MALIINGIYRTKENKIIVIPYNHIEAKDILYFEIDKELTTNGEINEYFRELNRTDGKEFCQHIKCESRNDLENILDGYLGELTDNYPKGDYHIFDDHYIYTTKDNRTMFVVDMFAAVDHGLLNAYFIKKKYTNFNEAKKDFFSWGMGRDNLVIISQQQIADLMDESLIDTSKKYSKKP